MKTAIYIEDGAVQLVITPESEFEKNALSGFEDKPLEVNIFVGSFYDCRGGWVKQADFVPVGMLQSGHRGDKSIILQIKEPRKDNENG